MQKMYLLNDTAYFVEKAIQALDTQIKAKHDYIFSYVFFVQNALSIYISNNSSAKDSGTSSGLKSEYDLIF